MAGKPVAWTAGKTLCWFEKRRPPGGSGGGEFIRPVCPVFGQGAGGSDRVPTAGDRELLVGLNRELEIRQRGSLYRSGNGHAQSSGRKLDEIMAAFSRRACGERSTHSAPHPRAVALPWHRIRPGGSAPAAPRSSLGTKP